MTTCPLRQRLFANQRFVGRISRNRMVSIKSGTTQSAFRSCKSAIHYQMGKTYFNFKLFFCRSCWYFHLILFGSAVFNCQFIDMWNKELLLSALVICMVSSFPLAYVKAKSLLVNMLASAEDAQWHDLHTWWLTNSSRLSEKWHAPQEEGLYLLHQVMDRCVFKLNLKGHWSWIVVYGDWSRYL